MPPDTFELSIESLSRPCPRNAFGEDGRDGPFLPVLVVENLCLLSTLGEKDDIDVGVESWLNGEFVYLVEGVSDTGRSREASTAFCVSAANGLRMIRCSFTFSVLAGSCIAIAVPFRTDGKVIPNTVPSYITSEKS